MRLFTAVVILLLLIVPSCAADDAPQELVCQAITAQVEADRALSDLICTTVAHETDMSSEICTEFVEAHRPRLLAIAAGELPASLFCDNLDLSPPGRHGCSIWENFACISPIHAATLQCHEYVTGVPLHHWTLFGRHS